VIKVITVAGKWTRQDAEALCRKLMETDADLALKSCFNITQTFSEIRPLQPHYSSNYYELETCITDVLVSLFRILSYFRDAQCRFNLSKVLRDCAVV